ncbi:hypothetical protein V6Z12_D06G209100 [Gossypium hirsutum]
MATVSDSGRRRRRHRARWPVKGDGRAARRQR